MKRVVLVGGGSGGHFYPLIAVAQEIHNTVQHKEHVDLIYMGPHAYDQGALDSLQIRFISCPAGKRRKYFSLLNYLDVFKIFFGIFVALYKLYVLYPDVVFSKGSYTSVPITIAAAILRIPVVIHESDSKPGSANKLASKFARYIAISFDEVAQYFPDKNKNIARTGVPLRTELLEEITNPFERLGLPSTRPLIFVTGGSFGAERLNNLILESLDELLPQYTILHQTGVDHEMGVGKTAATLITNIDLLEHYFVKGTLTAREMNQALSAASLIISRAGAGTIFEIAHKGKPSILIPIPEEVSHDQKSNAYAYARSGAGIVMEERNFADGLLASEINRIMGNPQTYSHMSAAAQAFATPNGARIIADTIVGIAHEHG